MAETLDSVAKALEILRLLEPGEQYGLTDIARTLGLGTSRVHRLLATLEAAGFVARDATDLRYRLTFNGCRDQAVGLGTMLEAAFPVLRRLRDESEETVHLGLLAGRFLYVVAGLESTKMMRVTSRVGTRLPAHATASGRILLSYLADDRIRRLFRLTQRQYRGDNAPSSMPMLLEQVAECRRQGYGRDLSGYEQGMATIAVPIPTGGPAPTFAIAISGPESRINPRRTRGLTTIERTHLGLLQKAASQVAAVC